MFNVNQALVSALQVRVPSLAHSQYPRNTLQPHVAFSSLPNIFKLYDPFFRFPGAAQAAVKARNDLKHDDTRGITHDVYESIFNGLRTFLECIAADQSVNADIAASARTSLDRLRELHDSGSRGPRATKTQAALYE